MDDKSVVDDATKTAVATSVETENVEMESLRSKLPIKLMCKLTQEHMQKCTLEKNS